MGFDVGDRRPRAAVVVVVLAAMGLPAQAEPPSKGGGLERGDDGEVVITITIPGREGGDDEVVPIGEVDLDAVPMVRFAASTRDDEGPCFVWREARQADVAYDLSLLQATTVAVTGSLPPCRRASGGSRITADDFVPALELAAVHLLPSPSFRVQPDDQPMAGKPSYLTGDVWAELPATPVVLASADGLVTVDATVTARVVEYWVDWDWDGAASIPGRSHAADRSVTGPHVDAPRPWLAGVPGNVPWTWQWSGPRTVAVVARWQVSATAPGLGDLGSLLVDVGPATTDVRVRQAQPVRRA